MKIDRRIKFRHLQCFLEVARNRSVGKAAACLSVTQPAVSKTIKELEGTLGVSLFDRSGRGVELTRFGAAFHRYAGASITALRQGVDSIAQARGDGGYSISVGALPTVATGVMPRAVRAFKDEGVATTVRVVTGANAVLLSQLRVGELDLVVGRLADPDLMAGLSFEHLYREKISFAVRAGHPLVGDPTFALNNLSRFTVLYPTKEAIIRPLVDRYLITNGVSTFPDQIETVSMAFGRSYVRATDAVWIISTGVIADDLDDGTLVELPVDTAEIVGSVGLTTRADTPPGIATQMLMQAIRDAAGRRGSADITE